MNESKSTHCTFTLRHGTCPTLFLNNQTLPNAQCVRYLGIHIDRRLTWAPHIKNKTHLDIWHPALGSGVTRNLKYHQGRIIPLRLFRPKPRAANFNVTTDNKRLNI
ncbi:ribosome biogenesis protein TSR3 isoform X1 [Aphis craccivora]|uniref:Ribosome biogenesis protein TSR3 isoform X1 n=1 Tax=Aphis craccivora TaxID=307492 RepID=A0A6G0VVH8_APHCR|nr:ribosome biogenesis protein TSR3 isoform X1 [Aphis craccivora]